MPQSDALYRLSERAMPQIGALYRLSEGYLQQIDVLYRVCERDCNKSVLFTYLVRGVTTNGSSLKT